MPKKRYIQIDVLKGIAMWMVLLNHSRNYVYSSELIFRLSRSCVQLLVFCAGINAALKLRTVFAEKQSNRGIVSLLWRRYWCPQIISICIPYFVFNGSFLFLWKKSIDFSTMWQYLIGFNIADPVYFIPVYFELVLVAPFVYYLVCRFRSKVWNLALGIVSLALCIWLAEHTYMLPIYGAGQYLFGATYGWVFILGVMFENRLFLKRSNHAAPIGCAAAIPFGILILWIASLKLLPEAHTKLERIFFNIGGNPPGLDSLAEGFLLIWMIWIVTTYAEYRFGDRAAHYFAPVISCGKHSLYIFLWHMFVKAGWNQVIAAAGLPQQSLLYAIPFYLGSTVGVIFVKKAIDYVKKDFVSTCLINGK